MSQGQGSAGNVLAAIASLIIPGLGQLLQGRVLWAMFWLFLGCVGFAITWLLTLSRPPAFLTRPDAPPAVRQALQALYDALPFTPRLGDVMALCKAGDKILFSKYSGNDIKIDGTEHLILREDDILAVLE